MSRTKATRLDLFERELSRQVGEMEREDGKNVMSSLLFVEVTFEILFNLTCSDGRFLVDARAGAFRCPRAF